MSYLTNNITRATNEVLAMMAGSPADLKDRAIRTYCGTEQAATVKILLQAQDILRIVVAEFSEECLLKVASSCFFSEETVLTEEVFDTAGELTNILAGSLGRYLEHDKLVYTLSPPILIKGVGNDIGISNNAPFLAIDFTLTGAPFTVSLSPKLREEENNAH